MKSVYDYSLSEIINVIRTSETFCEIAKKLNVYPGPLEFYLARFIGYKKLIEICQNTGESALTVIINYFNEINADNFQEKLVIKYGSDQFYKKIPNFKEMIFRTDTFSCTVEDVINAIRLNFPKQVLRGIFYIDVNVFLKESIGLSFENLKNIKTMSSVRLSEILGESRYMPISEKPVKCIEKSWIYHHVCAPKQFTIITGTKRIERPDDIVDITSTTPSTNFLHHNSFFITTEREQVSENASFNDELFVNKELFGFCEFSGPNEDASGLFSNLQQDGFDDESYNLFSL